jgi:hypothetical protein
MLKKILVAIVGLLVVATGGALVMPSKWHVEKSVSVKAKSETLYASVADLKQWESWTAWNKSMDPSAKREFTGAAMGQGSVMSWKSEKMGTGALTVTKADPKTGISYEMKMERMQTPSMGRIAFAAEGEGTKVTWVDDGDFGMFLPGRYFVGFMEKTLGKDFEESLGRLKTGAEKAQVAADEKAAGEAKAKAEAEAAAAAAKAAEEAKAAAEAAKKNPVKPAKGKGKGK